ncbi:hypothetical protein J0910_15775 [Nocardiopsis sp. CNT-189]|uniref:hypothetical protein n=1 Tax=Nocardiopsis oceanisediminis TaxID=2816862 RepID=UPI003B301B6A
MTALSGEKAVLPRTPHEVPPRGVLRNRQDDHLVYRLRADASAVDTWIVSPVGELCATGRMSALGYRQAIVWDLIPSWGWSREIEAIP